MPWFCYRWPVSHWNTYEEGSRTRRNSKTGYGEIFNALYFYGLSLAISKLIIKIREKCYDASLA